MAGKQSAQLERKKFFADPIMVSMIVVLLVFLALFILYPLLMLLVDSFYAEGTVTLDVFKRVLNLERFRNAFKNTLTLGFIVGFASTAIGLLFAYVEVYVKLKTKILEKLYKNGKRISIRPHPRYSNMDLVKKIFDFANVEDTKKISIEQSLLQSGAAISLYSTVLNQALCNSIPIIIDNMSNPENFNKLKELGYVCLYKEHRLLSEVLEKSV